MTLFLGEARFSLRRWLVNAVRKTNPGGRKGAKDLDENIG